MLAFLGVSKKLNQVGVKKEISSGKLVSLTRQPQDLESLVSRCRMESHTLIAVAGELTPTLEDVSCITQLPIFGEANVAGSFLRNKTR